MNDIDQYLAELPDDTRSVLEKLRSTIRAVAPLAAERISYRIPTFFHEGPLVGYAAFKDHCSFFVLSATFLDAFRNELAAYSTGKGTIHFTVERPLPVALVKKLVKAKMKENDARRVDKKAAHSRKTT